MTHPQSRSSNSLPISTISVNNITSSTTHNTPVFLQTASVTIYNPDHPDMTIRVRLILDCGSQCSYASDHVKNTLSISATHTEALGIKTFGSNKRKHENCHVIVIGIKIKDKTDLRLSLLVVPLICEPLSHQPVAYAKEEFDHLQGLDLADASCGTGCLGLDLLVGSDYYWRLVAGAVKRGSAGPVTMETRVGWVLLLGPMEDPSLFVNLISLESNPHTLCGQ